MLRKRKAKNCYNNIISFRIDGELVSVKDCEAYGEAAAPPQQNPTSELVIYASIS